MATNHEVGSSNLSERTTSKFLQDTHFRVSFAFQVGADMLFTIIGNRSITVS
jgi:uncharacterized membrane protein